MKISYTQFLTAVDANESEVLPTAGGNASFVATRTDQGVQFKPTSSGKPRKLSRAQIEPYLEIFNLTGSTTTSDYAIHRNPSYVLAFFKIIIGQHVAKTPSKGEGLDEVEIDLVNEAKEGKRIVRMHRGRERSPELVSAAKKVFRMKHERLFCEVCGFDFEIVYGESDFIEAHHVVPLKDLRHAKTTKISDLAMVCANCHRMLHRGQSWPTVDELKERVLRLRRDAKFQPT